MSWAITAHHTLSVARSAGIEEDDLRIGEVAILTFSKAIMDRLEELADLEDTTWIGPEHHPYAGVHIIKRGEIEGVPICALVPPMGASPLACIMEDLITCGVRALFLVCAAWSLGAPVQFGDLILPTFAVGPDGTSIHYGNTRGEITAENGGINTLSTACQIKGIHVLKGGVACCEALYRISPQMMEEYRARGCLCMENGEAATLYSLTQEYGVIGGVLFQPYIDLTQGWQPDVLRSESYRETSILQAEVVVEAVKLLSRKDDG